MPVSSPSRLICPERLFSLLEEARGRFSITALVECASPNNLLLDRAEDGAPSGRVRVADCQTAGRGSRGRHWLSAPQDSLTFSVLWRFSGGIERLPGLSLAVGVAVVHALEACGVFGMGLKWPNDLLYEDRKLGGVLVELVSEKESTQAVVGIGLNLHLPESVGDGNGFALPATALDAVLSPLPERHVLLAQLLIELAHVFDRFAAGGFAVLRDQWLARHVWQDRRVCLVADGRPLKEGVCCGVDGYGALLVQTENGIERCLSGDLSLRVAPP